MNELLESAIQYAGMGLAVFPLIPRDKRPITKNGFHDATTDIDTIKRWWTTNPNANIGIATGEKSGGLVVIDMDCDDEVGKDGYTSFNKWITSNYLIVPDTWTAITGRGGYHMIFKSDFPVRSKVEWIEAVDVRADGGYIVAPPSIHPNGNTYTWEYAPSDLDIADTSDTDVEFICNSINVDSQKENKPLEVPDEIPKGHRDEMMFKLACKYQAMGMSDEAMFAALSAENQQRCKPPLTECVIRQKVKQAQKFHKGESINAKITTDDGVVHKQSYSRKRSHEDEVITADDLKMPTLAEYDKRTKDWLVPGYIPKGCVTLLCSDGGIGKTSVWCDTLACLTKGRQTLFDKAINSPFFEGVPRNVMYFSKEDPTEEVLKWKFENADGDQNKVWCFTLDDDRINRIRYDSPLLEALIKTYQPDICVFDTLQAFLPDGTDMAKRKDMRDALNPLNQLGAQYGTAFLMIMHTNKSANSGRQRMADSSDIWDIGRSALMCGRTKDGDICYMSHEKCNYGKLQKTILFSVSDSGVEYRGTSSRKDADYVADGLGSRVYPTPKLNEAKDFILEYLAGSDGRMAEINQIVENGTAAGISKHSLEDGRASLIEEGIIERKSFGFAGEKKWYLLLPSNNTPE